MLDNKDNLPLIGVPCVERSNLTILTKRKTVIENKFQQNEM